MSTPLYAKLTVSSLHVVNRFFLSMQAKIADHLLLGLRNISSLSSVKYTSLHPPFRPSSEFLSLSFETDVISNRRCGKNIFLKLPPFTRHGKLDCFIGNFSRPGQVSDHHRNCLSHHPMLVPLRQASASSDSRKPGNLPNQDRLRNVQNLMVEQISQIFSGRHEYRIYTKDLIFENNWDLSQPYATVGVTAYAVKLLKARFYMNCKYARVKVNVLGSSIHEELGCVCVRWRVGGLPQHKAFMFWKYMPFRIRKTADNELEWLDGLSTFFVTQQGLVFKHRIDRVIPDSESSLLKQEKKSELEGMGPAAV